MKDSASVIEITKAHRQFAANALHNLPFAKLIGMRLVDLKLDEATISIEMRDDLRQPSGVLHGGVTATLIDTAMAFAVRTRLELKEVDEALDHFKGDPDSAEYAALVERELWAAAQLELHGDPPPPRIRNVSSLGAHEDYAKTAQAEGDTEGEAAPHAEDGAKH
jgi:hypothetical protein